MNAKLNAKGAACWRMFRHLWTNIKSGMLRSSPVLWSAEASGALPLTLCIQCEN